jgi:uncharacterized membrane protein
VRTDRLQALADGVFAIALTLLVLGLPALAGSTDLAADLLSSWPSYAAYVVSFVTIAIVWVNHHALFDTVRTADRTLVELNLLLLLFVSVVPWPTRLVADHLRDPSQARAAAVTYGLVMTAMSGTFTLIWVRLVRGEELVHPEQRPRLRRALRRSAVGPASYAAATAVAFVSAPAAFVLYGALAAYFAVSGRRR